jgi:hypothetical protein
MGNTNIFTMMIGSSCESLRYKRGFDTSYINDSIVHGELLPLYHVSEGDGVDGVIGATRSGSYSVSPPILAVCRSVLCISCFFTAPSQKRQRGIYSQF